MRKQIRTILPIFGALFLLMLPFLMSGSRSVGGERQSHVSNSRARRDGARDRELTFQETYQLNLDTPFPGVAGRIRMNLGEMFVIDGNTIHLLQQEDGNWQFRASFDNGREVLDIEEGAIRHQILALDRTGLRIIDFFSSDQPEVAGEFAIDNRNLAPGGHYVERFGSYAYVIDSSIGGFKVLDIEAPKAAALKAEFSGSSGLPSNIQLRNRTVYLLTPSELVAVGVGDFLDPKPQLAGKFRTSGAARSMAMNDSYAFLADGSRVTVLNIDADSQNYLRDESTYDIPFQIGNVIVRDAKIYLMGTGGALQVFDIPAYDRN